LTELSYVALIGRNTWEEARPILSDPSNSTEFGGAPVLDPVTGAVTFVHNQAVFGSKDCSACVLWGTTSFDEGATWTTPRLLNITGAANSTWGGALASGITLKRGKYAGRMMVALRHDCGCGERSVFRERNMAARAHLTPSVPCCR
jgi:hypothetical protein